MINKVSVWVCTLAMLGLVFSPVTEAIGSSGSSSSSSTSSSSSSSSSSSTSSTTSTSLSARASVASRAAQSNMSTNINSSRNATSQKANSKTSSTKPLSRPYHSFITPTAPYSDQRLASMYFNNTLFFWIVMQHHNLNIKQQYHILQNNMTAKDKLYTITIKDKRDKEHLIVVPKKDYDAIQKGAHVKYKNGKLITTHK